MGGKQCEVKLSEMSEIFLVSMAIFVFYLTEIEWYSCTAFLQWKSNVCCPPPPPPPPSCSTWMCLRILCHCYQCSAIVVSSYCFPRYFWPERLAALSCSLIWQVDNQEKAHGERRIQTEYNGKKCEKRSNYCVSLWRKFVPITWSQSDQNCIGEEEYPGGEKYDDQLNTQWSSGRGRDTDPTSWG